MSTRSQTEFIAVFRNEDGEESIDKRTIYRHSDGYPSAMLPDLLTFIRWNQGRMDDVEYAAANWIFWNKRRMEDALLNPDWKLLKRRTNLKWDDKEVEKDCNNVLKLGFGVCNNYEFHGDIEYLYRVICDVTRLRIEVYAVVNTSYDEPITEYNFRLLGRLQVPDDLSDENISRVSQEFVATIRDGDE